MAQTITIAKKEYNRLKKIEQVDTELLRSIARGIKDIAEGRVKEV